MNTCVFVSVLASLSILFAPVSSLARSRGVVIEDFESGTVELESYPDQDQEPSAWELTSDDTYGGTSYALRIHGNSWKVETIPATAAPESTVWQVAIQGERLGEMQAFGVGDGINELLYTVAGDQLPEGSQWWTVYQGAFPMGEWYAYLLPIGRDWFATYGYEPILTKLIYVNDDDAGMRGVTLWDEIRDVTEDLPIVPEVEIIKMVGQAKRVSRNLYRVGVQFHAEVYDPDSESHLFHWDFGDSTTSAEQDPAHEFLAEAGYTYTIGLLVRDPDGLAGNDTCQVRVEPGVDDVPILVNFVGDIMTCRSYEAPGGIIDTQGIDAIFDPTRPILGEAADVSVCNLECSYTDRGQPHPTKSVVFRSRPENIVGIVDAGIDVVNVGNNHIIDYGEEGMLQTFGLLDSLDIGYSGAGVNDYFALQPTFWTERGVRIAFIGQCNRTGRQWNYQPFLDAGYNKPGFAYLLPMNEEGAIGAVRDLADIVIAQFHSGDEYETEPPPGAASTASDGLERTPAGLESSPPGLASPPPVEAAVIGPEDPRFRFPTEPTPGDRELRRMAIDQGADIVINHHPHVLQGFESYHGRLIAHSLGNFVFDLYYPETMPTIVLTLEIDKYGILGCRFVPAWIDDYIPQPATGTLGREIMDRMADYSRPMHALVAVSPEENLARVYPSRSGVDSTTFASVAPTPLLAEDGYQISPPILLSGQGNLSRVISVTGGGSGSWEVCWGREILWHGGFEDEGATLWDVNSPDEWLDEGEAHRGARSLALRRSATDTQATGTDLERHLPCDPDQRHSALAWEKADNAAEQVVMARFYSNRTASTPISSTDLGPRFTGTQDWVQQWAELETPANGIYFEMRCSDDAPETGTGLAWFDDLAFIEWEPWVAVEGALDVPSPNNYRFLQVRTSDPGAVSAVVSYEETAYGIGGVPTGLWPGAPGNGWVLRSYPNPFSPPVRIELDFVTEPWRGSPAGSAWAPDLAFTRGAGPAGDRAPGSALTAASSPAPAASPVDLAIFDVGGRRVATLFRGSLSDLRSHVFLWDGRDARGRPVPSGIYLTRAAVAGAVRGGKILLTR
jgi:poly-gamma-glutamate capsule biosynthesis protein CapA/YwtB (metallophosphatase superfamily)